MFKIGDRVRLYEATRADFLEYRGSGEHVEVARENRTGTVVQRVGTPGRHLVIGYLDFGETYFVVSGDGLIPTDEVVEESDPEMCAPGLHAPTQNSGLMRAKQMEVCYEQHHHYGSVG